MSNEYCRELNILADVVDNIFITSDSEDATAPTYSSGAVEEATPTVVIATFNEVINSPGADYTAGFTIKVDAVSATISSAVRGTNQATIEFTLSARIYTGETVTIDYDSGVGDITDQAASPNDLATFTGSSVTNNTTTAAPSGFAVLESDGTSHAVSLNVLESDTTSHVVLSAVLESDTTSHNPI